MRLDQFQRMEKSQLIRKPRLPGRVYKIARLQRRRRAPAAVHDAAKAPMLTRKHFGHELALAKMARTQHDGVISPVHQSPDALDQRTRVWAVCKKVIL